MPTKIIFISAEVILSSIGTPLLNPCSGYVQSSLKHSISCCNFIPASVFAAVLSSIIASRSSFTPLLSSITTTLNLISGTLKLSLITVYLSLSSIIATPSLIIPTLSSIVVIPYPITATHCLVASALTSLASITATHFLIASAHLNRRLKNVAT